MRLDQFIASATQLSRKEARQAIRAGRVMVDQQTCRNPACHVDREARVIMDNEPLVLPGHRYLMLNKPAGVLSATRDSNQPTALDLLPAGLGGNLHIAGRLDADTTGLLLLTSDGQWSHRVTSPKARCPKTYRVSLAEAITREAIQALERGVYLNHEARPTRPARVEWQHERLIDLTISEGRYHQIKRMLAAVGNRVVALHRHRIGEIRLDPALAPGEFRELTAEEKASLG